ncbi:MAG: hypothetical protein Q9195_007898 [Heterodermia aff. obscurata]
MASFPYIPTRILPDPSDEGTFYIFRSATSSEPDAQLLALNVSATKSFDSTSLPLSTLSTSLPFFTPGKDVAYTPAVDKRGNLLLYAGDCQAKEEESTFWAYKPANGSSSLNGTWTQSKLSLDSSTDHIQLTGANYLSSGIAFSNTANSTSQMYVFGGMCPRASRNSSDSVWTENSDYSNSMLAIEPSLSSSENYQLGAASSRGPPIPEAGFTITPLEPTFSQSSVDNNTQHQNQNFVLLGGHTPTAFINMSQVALFSLPEQTWSFLPVDAPGSTPKTDLTARTVPNVDPRSGHTAVLTPDGKQIVVFGGWVGDVSTAAEPQLAILELGDGYGGSGDWQWSIPALSGTGPSESVGVYGHGAAMLPGGVMMITGGYTTAGSSSTKAKRAASPWNTDNYFLNTTSKTWIASYTHPEPHQSHQVSTSSDEDRLTTSKRVGLGAGLTFGVLAVIAVVIVYFWYSRRLKRRRDAREEELRHLGLDAHRSHSSMLRPDGMIRTGSEMTARDAYMMARGPGDKAVLRNHADAEAERTGLLFEIPSPTRGLRRSLHSRGAYQPAPRYDDGRLNRGSGNIHPIDERDEYDEEMIDGVSSADPEARRHEPDIGRSAPVLDPFTDTYVSRTPSPQSPARERELEQQNWVSDWAAADALMHYHGRQSPDKNDRTSSTLSDQSTRSMVSAQSWQHSVGSMSRSMSQRSTALFSKPFSPSNETNPALPPVDVERAQSMTGIRNPSTRRSHSLTLFSNPRRSHNSETVTMTPPSFPQLQSESEALLGGYEDRSPTRSQSRAREWIGGIRRVFTGTDRGASTSPDHGGTSAASSPTRYHHPSNEAGVPRRAASTGAMLWQKRQGARDWDVEGSPSRVEGGDGQERKEVDDEEWDVESAVERRVVQVMFTVPKEKLRVVNRGPDGDGISVVSRESSLKDAGKSELAGVKEKD